MLKVWIVAWSDGNPLVSKPIKLSETQLEGADLAFAALEQSGAIEQVSIYNQAEYLNFKKEQAELTDPAFNRREKS